MALLEEDPGLGTGLSGAPLAAAHGSLRAPVIHLEGPDWAPPGPRSRGDFGLLVLDGLIGRRLQVGAGVATELLSDGDILRPWEQPAADEVPLPHPQWRVYGPTRLAILDARITGAIGQHPQLVLNFSARLLRRVRMADYLMTISHLPRVEDRLLAVLWHIAATRGRVTREGVVLPLRLTHGQLAEVVGARRPSVTAAVTSLTQCERLRRTSSGGYILLGGAPEQSELTISDGDGDGTPRSARSSW